MNNPRFRQLTALAVMAALLAAPIAYAQEESKEFKERFEMELKELHKYLEGVGERQQDMSEELRKMIEERQGNAIEIAEKLFRRSQELIEDSQEELGQRLDATHKIMEERARDLAELTRHLLEEAKKKAEDAREQHARQEPVSRILHVEHADMEQVLSVLQPLFDLEISANEELGVLGVRGSDSAVNAFEEALSRLDVPPEPAKNIQLRVYLIAAGEGLGEDAEVPGELEPAINELRNVFHYSGWRVLDTSFIRCRDGERANLGGYIEGGNSGEIHEYNFGADKFSVNPGNHSIRIDGLEMSLEMTKAPIRSMLDAAGPQAGKMVEKQTAYIQADVDLKLGQIAVVGKASVTGDYEALFLTLTADVVE